MRKKIIITGGAGFIGHHIIKNLISDKRFNQYEILAIDNLYSGNLKNLEKFSNKISLLKADINDKNQIAPYFKNCQYIIHLAANVSVQKSMREPILSANINLFGFLNIIELAKENNIEKFIYASSAAIYGNNSDILGEETNPNPISPYGFEKLANEFYAKFYQKEYGLNCVGLRLFNVYGAGNNKNSEYSGVIKIFIDKAKNGENLTIYGDGKQIRDFVNVNDIAKIFLEMLLAKNCQPIYNIASGNPISILELANLIKNIYAKKEIHLEFKPKREGDVIKSQPNIDKIMDFLGKYNFIGIKEGLGNIW